MRQVFGALAALVIGWGFCAPAHTQELFPLQAISGGGGSGPCAGGDSGFVPAGYKCVESSTDEFNGSSIDTNKWSLTSAALGQSEGGGVLHCDMAQPGPFNGSSNCSMLSKFPIPDAPMYLEFRRRLTETGLYQFWISTCADTVNHTLSPTCTGEETDVDLGYQCGGQTSLCTGMFEWDSGAGQNLFLSYPGGPSPLNDGSWHTIMLQRLPDPTPNGTVRWGVDGTWLLSYTAMPDNRWVFPSQWLSTPGITHDVFEMDYFCNGSSCPNPGYIDWDYIRVYTPSGLPNGY